VSRAGLSLAVVLLIVGVPAPAAAFERSGGVGGVCLWWTPRSVAWQANVVRHGAAPTCGAEATMDAVAAGFAAWTPLGDATCADLELPGSVTASTEAGYDPDGPNTNLVVFRHGACSLLDPTLPCFAKGTCPNDFGCWDDATPADRDILALTSVSYSLANGAILDADVEVNDWDGVDPGAAIVSRPLHGWYITCSGAGPVCQTYGESGCQYLDLQSVLTHEAGHFLGLGDVALANVTMNASSLPGDVSRRTLAPDDVAGVCAIYPPGEASPVCTVHSTGCGCGAGAAPSSLLLWSLLALAIGSRRSAKSAAPLA
jgi:hypothetical protein